eukprot:1146805-Pelagomonas_calceolata.AAC.6
MQLEEIEDAVMAQPEAWPSLQLLALLSVALQLRSSTVALVQKNDLEFSELLYTGEVDELFEFSEDLPVPVGACKALKEKREHYRTMVAACQILARSTERVLCKRGFKAQWEEEHEADEMGCLDRLASLLLSLV